MHYFDSAIGIALDKYGSDLEKMANLRTKWRCRFRSLCGDIGWWSIYIGILLTALTAFSTIEAIASKIPTRIIVTADACSLAISLAVILIPCIASVVYWRDVKSESVTNTDYVGRAKLDWSLLKERSREDMDDICRHADYAAGIISASASKADISGDSYVNSVTNDMKALHELSHDYRLDDRNLGLIVLLVEAIYELSLSRKDRDSDIDDESKALIHEICDELVESLDNAKDKTMLKLSALQNRHEESRLDRFMQEYKITAASHNARLMRI